MDNKTRPERLTPLIFEHDSIATFTVSDSSDPTDEHTRAVSDALAWLWEPLGARGGA